MLPIRINALLAAVVVAGCANSPPVQPAATSKSQFEGAAYAGEVSQLAAPTPGTEVYRAFYQGGSSFVSIGSVREAVEELATKQCARYGKGVRPIQETTSKPPHILGNYPRVEWLFECAVATPAAISTGQPNVDKLSQLERLKKLLDSGTLTQQEFDREKAKILGMN